MIRKVLLSVAILVAVLGFTASAASAQGLSDIINDVIGGLLGGGDDTSSADYTPPPDVGGETTTRDPGTSGSTGLAPTGSNTVPMMIAGASAVALGGALLVTTRRRRTA